MPAPMAGNTASKGGSSGAAVEQKKKSGIIVPFARAAKKHIEKGQTFVTAPPWGGQIVADVPSYGFLSGVCITISATGGAASVTVTKKEDAPWSVVKNLLLSDTNGTPIVNIDGYSLYLARLFGGYYLYKPDGSTFGFLDVVTGASASGNFKIKIFIFMEFGKDGLGCLPNMDASAKYKLILSLGAPSDVYGTAPNTTVPTLNTTVELLARMRPAAVDAFGNSQETNPPCLGTVQYWTSQQFALAAAENTIQLARVGNLVRNHLLIIRASSDSTRATGETNVVPSSLEFQWDDKQRFICNVDTLRQISFQETGVDAPNGVIPLLNTTDTESHFGSEYGDDWLPTVSSTKLALKFTCANAGTLTVLTNDVVPGVGNIFAAPLLQIGGA